jgi:hypothetical protein
MIIVDSEPEVVIELTGHFNVLLHCTGLIEDGTEMDGKLIHGKGDRLMRTFEKGVME